jgi:hypothetical protein
MFHCAVTMLHGGVTFLLCIVTMLHCAVKVLHSAVTVLLCAVR